jgi:hypothetical protein
VTSVFLSTLARTAAGMLVVATVALAGSGSAADASRRVSPRTVQFSGYTWEVKSSDEGVGPGPNYFSGSTDNVRVDSSGRLHLKLTYSNGRWYCAEVINTQSLGLGRYSFRLGSPVSDLDSNVVLGLFTWSDDPAYNNREIDIEFSRWAKSDDLTNGQYVVQPYQRTRNLRRISQRPLASSTHSFDWRRTAVRFASSSAAPSTWTYRGSDIPVPGSEHVRMNLWLFRGAFPTDGRSAEVIVKSFKFEPARHR